MDHQAVILGELKGFRQESLRRFDALEKEVSEIKIVLEELKTDKAIGKAKVAAFSTLGGIAGSIITWVVMYLCK